jgi:hypothetical protein
MTLKLYSPRCTSCDRAEKDQWSDRWLRSLHETQTSITEQMSKNWRCALCGAQYTDDEHAALDMVVVQKPKETE